MHLLYRREINKTKLFLSVHGIFGFDVRKGSVDY